MEGTFIEQIQARRPGQGRSMVGTILASNRVCTLVVVQESQFRDFFYFQYCNLYSVACCDGNIKRIIPPLDSTIIVIWEFLRTLGP